MSQTVLVADDSKTIRQIVEMALKASTWEVVGVDSAQDAMQAARQNPSVILLDYYMPDGSGYDVCRALKQDAATRTIPIVMLGGTYKAFDEDMARQAGADIVLMKPFKTDQLINAIEDAQKAETALPIPSIPEPEPEAEPEEEYGYGAGDEESSEPIYTAPEPEPEPVYTAPDPEPEPVFDPPTTEAPVYELPISDLEEDSDPMPTPVPQPPSQPRIPVQPSRGSSPDIQPSREPIATPVPTPTSAQPAPTPTPQAAPAEPSMSRDEIQAMIREEVKSAVRNELPGLLRNVMGEIFQNKILPKLMQHAEARVKSVVTESLATQIQSQVRSELERLLSEE